MKRFLLLATLLCPALHAATIACVTTPGTYNASAGASWIGGVAPVVTGGDLITCGTTGVTIVFDVNYIIGNSPASGNVITFTGAAVLGIAQNITLTAQGGVSVAGSIQFAAGSVLKFESASAGSPTATPYTLTAVTATADGTHPPTSANRFLVTADTVSGTNWRWANSTAGSGTSGWVNGEAQFCGDPAGAAPCFPYTPGGAHGSLNFGGAGTPFIFDHTCGVKWGTGYTSADSWDFQNVSFENTYTACAPWTAQTGFNVPSGTRLFDTVVFDLAPSIEDQSATYNHSIFLQGYIDPVAFTGNGYGLIENSVIVTNWQSGTLTWNANLGLSILDFTLTNDTVIGDPTTTIVSGVPTAPTPLVTGTATTTCTSGSIFSTLTDTTKSFTTNQFQTNGTFTYTIVLTGGMGKGQARVVATNTATVLSTLENWKTTCDATSTYAIYKGPNNVHWTNGQSLPLGFSEPPYIGNIFQLVTDADNEGDIYHAINAIQGTTCNLWNGAWSSSHLDPNTGLANYAQFSGVSEAGVFYRSSVLVASSVDPSTDGGVHWTVASTLASMFSGCGVHEMDNNVMLANVADDNSGTFLTGGNAFYKGSHNTYFTGAQSAAFGESRPAAFPGQFLVWQENLAWAEPGRTYVVATTASASTIGPYVLADTGSAGGAGPGGGIYLFSGANTCSFSGTTNCVDYDGEYGLLTNGWCALPGGANQGGSTAMNSDCNSPMGSHDIVGNPGLLILFPSPAKWLQTLGIDTSLSDPVLITPDVYACLMKINDPSGWNPSCTIANLYNYLHNAVNFTNVAFHNAGADSLDIGAGQYQAPTVSNYSNGGNFKMGGASGVQ